MTIRTECEPSLIGLTIGLIGQTIGLTIGLIGMAIGLIGLTIGLIGLTIGLIGLTIGLTIGLIGLTIGLISLTIGLIGLISLTIGLIGLTIGLIGLLTIGLLKGPTMGLMGLTIGQVACFLEHKDVPEDMLCFTHTHESSKCSFDCVTQKMVVSRPICAQLALRRPIKHCWARSKTWNHIALALNIKKQDRQCYTGFKSWSLIVVAVIRKKPVRQYWTERRTWRCRTPTLQKDGVQMIWFGAKMFMTLVKIMKTSEQKISSKIMICYNLVTVTRLIYIHHLSTEMLQSCTSVGYLTNTKWKVHIVKALTIKPRQIGHGMSSSYVHLYEKIPCTW
jgi:hypothetical protein